MNLSKFKPDNLACKVAAQRSALGDRLSRLKRYYGSIIAQDENDPRLPRLRLLRTIYEKEAKHFIADADDYFALRLYDLRQEVAVLAEDDPERAEKIALIDRLQTVFDTEASNREKIGLYLQAEKGGE